MWMQQIRKILHSRLFLPVLVCLFLIEAGVIVLQNTRSSQEVLKQKELYSMISAPVSDSSMEEKAAYYSLLRSLASEIADYETSLYLPDPDMPVPVLSEQAMQLKDWLETQNAEEWKQLIEDLDGYYAFIAGYPEYIQETLRQSEAIRNSPAYRTYSASRKKVLETQTASLSSLAGRQLQDEGVLFWHQFSSRLTQFVLLVILIWVSIQSTKEDQEAGMEMLAGSTKKGRARYRWSQLLGTLITGLVCTGLFVLINFALCARLYGMPESAVSIQSVPGFFYSVLPLNTWQYFWIWTAFELLAAMALCSLVFLLYLHFRKIGLILFALIFGAGSVLSTTVDPYSWLAWLRNLNFYAVFFPAGVLEENSLLAGIPAFIWSAVFLGVILAVCAALTLLPAAHHHKEASVQWFSVHSGSFFKNELYRTFVKNRFSWLAVLILLAAAANGWRGAAGVDRDYRAWSAQPYENISGPVSEETQLQLSGLEEDLQQALQEMQQAAEDYENGLIQQEDLTSAMDRYNQIRAVNRQYWQVLDQLDSGSDYLVYPAGYQVLFGLTASGRDFLYGLCAVFCLVLVLSGLFSSEAQNGEDRFCLTFLYGRGHRTIVKAGVCVLWTAVVFFFLYGMDLLQILWMYPLEDWQAPFQSLVKAGIELAPGFVSSVPLWEYYVCELIFRFLILLAASFLILAVSMTSRSAIASLLICLMILLIPELISQLGFDYVDSINVIRQLGLNLYAGGASLMLIPVSLLAFAAALGWYSFRQGYFKRLYP